MQSCAILARFLRRQIGGKHAVGTVRRGGFCKFRQSHLQEGIEITKEHQRHVRARAQVADEFEHAGKSCPAA